MSIPDFLYGNLRGAAFKGGPVAVVGWHPAIEFVADRARDAHLFETNFIRHPMIEGVARKKPPTLPGNVALKAGPAGQYGAVVIFRDIPGIYPDPVPGARIMGPLGAIKAHLRGRKFFILNRFSDWVCVELG